MPALELDSTSGLQRRKDEWVLCVLGIDASHGGAGAPPRIDIAALQQARQGWAAAQRKVRRDVEALQETIVTAYTERGLGPQLTAAYRRNVTDAMAAFDEDLTDTLDRLVAAEPGNPRWDAWLDTARDAVDELEAFVAANGVIDGLDRNPFGAALSVRSTLASSLKVIAKVLG